MLQSEESDVDANGKGPITVAPGWPKFADGRVCTSAEQSIGPVEHTAWDFRVGAHQVLRKWLKDRRGRELSEADLQTYRRLIHAITRTAAVMKQIDNDIQHSGGWATA